MRPLTTKQSDHLNKVCDSAHDFQLTSYENLQSVGELRNWQRFDSDILEQVEKKFAEIAKIGEEISNLVCILKDVR